MIGAAMLMLAVSGNPPVEPRPAIAELAEICLRSQVVDDVIQRVRPYGAREVNVDSSKKIMDTVKFRIVDFEFIYLDRKFEVQAMGELHAFTCIIRDRSATAEPDVIGFNKLLDAQPEWTTSGTNYRSASWVSRTDRETRIVGLAFIPQDGPKALRGITLKVATTPAMDPN